jgi:hypothetical protein
MLIAFVSDIHKNQISIHIDQKHIKEEFNGKIYAVFT